MPLTRPEEPASSQTVSGLLHQLVAQLTMLIRQEFALARTELHQNLTRLLSTLGAIAGGLALLYAGFLLLLGAAVFGLALLMPLWLAALGVGVIVFTLGLWIVLRGQRLLASAHQAPSHLSPSLHRDWDVLLRRRRS